MSVFKILNTLCDEMTSKVRNSSGGETKSGLKYLSLAGTRCVYQRKREDWDLGIEGF